jgi:MoaA/NifB/PqqE/SkfB family radical SAM enzyme
MLRNKYKNVWRDLWPAIEYGNREICCCPTVNRAYINPKGDVMPCPFIHIKIGNIYEQSLREILDYGFSIKWFSENGKKCYSAEDREFTMKYLQKEEMSVMNPIPAREVFADDDYVRK